MIALLLAVALCPHPHRSKAVISQFRKMNPCPVTCATYVKRAGKFIRYAKCGACQVDHVCPLHACGVDAPRNMRWLDAKENRKKSDDPSLCTPDLIDLLHAWKVGGE